MQRRSAKSGTGPYWPLTIAGWNVVGPSSYAFTVDGPERVPFDLEPDEEVGLSVYYSIFQGRKLDQATLWVISPESQYVEVSLVGVKSPLLCPVTSVDRRDAAVGGSYYFGFFCGALLEMTTSVTSVYVESASPDFAIPELTHPDGTAAQLPFEVDDSIERVMSRGERRLDITVPFKPSSSGRFAAIVYVDAIGQTFPAELQISVNVR